MRSKLASEVILVARPAEGGIRSHIIQLLTHLDRTRFALTLGAPSKLIASLPSDLPSYAPIELPIGARPSHLDVIAAIRLATLAKKRDAIVHAHGIRAGFVAALARKMTRFPLIVTYHNIPGFGKLTRRALDFIAANSDAIITVSHAIAHAIGDSRAIVIPNGVNLSAFGNYDRNEERAALQLGQNETVVACVARLSPEKGVDLLLKAAALLPELTILIAGSGPESAKLESSAPPNVRFLGYVDTTARLYAAADIAVIPSRTEGQGIVALEAMAAGVSIAAFAVGGLGEMIEDGVTGLLAEPEDPGALAEAIRKLANDPALRAKFATQAREWVTANGDVREKIGEVAEVYENLSSHPTLT